MNLRILALASCSLLGCAEAPVLRVVSLSMEGHPPAMDSLLQGDRLRLVLHELEPVREGALCAWARGSQGWIALGPLEAGESSTFTLADPLEVEEVLITHELEPSATSPSTELIFRGRPGEPLTAGGYGGPTAENLPQAHLTAELEDERLVLRSTSLPFVGAGLHYALWVRHEGAAGLLLGKLGASGKDSFTADQLLADFDEVVLTLELDAGDEAFGTELMVGHTLPASATVQTAAPVHEH